MFLFQILYSASGAYSKYIQPISPKEIHNPQAPQISIAVTESRRLCLGVIIPAPLSTHDRNKTSLPRTSVLRSIRHALCCISQPIMERPSTLFLQTRSWSRVSDGDPPRFPGKSVPNVILSAREGSAIRVPDQGGHDRVICSDLL